MIADKSRRKWGKIGLASLTFLSLGRRIDYERGTSKSRLHHDLRISFSQKRMLKRKSQGQTIKKRSHEIGKNGFASGSRNGLKAQKLLAQGIALGYYGRKPVAL